MLYGDGTDADLVILSHYAMASGWLDSESSVMAHRGLVPDTFAARGCRKATVRHPYSAAARR